MRVSSSSTTTLGSGRTLAEGQDNSYVAAELSLSLKTVRNYVSSILTKLEVSGRAQAIVKAREAGLRATEG